MRHLGRTFPAEEIYERVWGETAYSVENTVMVHIRRIREKIEINPREPKYLKVVWGIGYKIEKSKPWTAWLSFYGCQHYRPAFLSSLGIFVL